MRPRLKVLNMVAALAALGLVALAAPAHAAANIQIAGPASPVSVGTSYTYTVTIPDTGGGLFEVTADLSGAAATFTDAQSADQPN